MEPTPIRISEKLAICYTVCVPTYKATAREKLTNLYRDHPDLYYFVITDDKTYFADVPRKNLVVRELTEIYEEYPEIEQNEWFLDSGDSIRDYGNRVKALDYKFPFPVTRFHLKLAVERGIYSVAMLGTDSDLNFHILDDTQPGGSDLLSQKNTIFNTVSWWTESLENSEPMRVVSKIIEDKYGLVSKNPDHIWVYDEAARLYVFENAEMMNQLFDMWHYVVGELYETKEIQRLFLGWYGIHEEHLLGVIYDVLGIKKPDHMFGLFNTRHDPINERPWLCHEIKWDEK